MIKKTVLLLAACALVGGAVWAQAVPGPVPNPPGGPLPGERPGIPGGVNAVGTLSTEARFSAGRFTTDVDGFVNPRFHNPDIGTFFFLGGFPAAGNDVTNTNVLGNRTRISLGFAQTFGAFYLGVYYGGNIVNGGGFRFIDERDSPSGAREITASDMLWQNNLAVLFGILGMGFRLDLIANTDTERRTEDGYPGVDGPFPGLPGGGTVFPDADWRRFNAPAFGLTWGTRLGNLSPFAHVFYKLPDRFVWGGYHQVRLPDGSYMLDGAGDPVTQNVEYVLHRNSWIGLTAGARLALNPDANIGAEVRFGYRFEDRDRFTWGADSDSVRAGGAWNTGIFAYYTQSIDAGIVAVRLRPWLDAGYTQDLRNNSLLEDYLRVRRNHFVSLAAGADLGIRVQPNPTFAFFTGAGLRFVEWNYAASAASEREPYRFSSWTIQGIGWDQRRTAGAGDPNATGHLGFGMTVTPAPGIVIGAGLNTILDRLFVIDLEQMQVRSGDWWGNAADSANSVGAVTSFFRDFRFDLTLSVRVGGNGNGAGTPPPPPPPPPPAPAPVLDPALDPVMVEVEDDDE